MAPPPRGAFQDHRAHEGSQLAVSFAAERFLPLVINISFGNTYGSHDGTSLLETFLDDIGNYGRTTILAGTGNEGASSGHTSGTLQMRRTEKVEFTVSPYESSFSIQLWKSYTDQFTVSLQAPSGERFGPFSEKLGPPGSVTEKHRSSCITGNRVPTAQPRSCTLSLFRMRAAMWRKESGAFI